MKKLLVGTTIVWDTLAVALGYLNQPLDSSRWYGNHQLQQKGSALMVGRDYQGDEVLALGSPQPLIIRKVVEELIKLGCPDTEPVEVIVLSLPGQKFMRPLMVVARWRIIGSLALNLAARLASHYQYAWWDEGRRLAATKIQVVTYPSLRHN